jgi:hypothetical protein
VGWQPRTWINRLIELKLKKGKHIDMAGMFNGTILTATAPGDQQIVLAATPVNLKPGMPIILGVRTRLVVANTYTGSSTTVPINGAVGTNHNAGATVQWDGNLEPGLTGS